NPQSFFHISRPEIGLPRGADEHSQEVYQLGKRNLDAFQSKGWLVQDPEPRLYLYRQRMGRHVQVGVVATASIDEYDQGLIKKHERPRPEKEDDRTRHIEALGANDEPVFLTYRARREIDELIARLVQAAPDFDFVTEDEVGHAFWSVPTSETVQLV